MPAQLLKPHYLLLLAVIVYGVAWRAISIDRPFEYDDEGTGAAYGVFARNYVTFGLWQTHALMVPTVGEPPPDTPLAYYPDHPPLASLLIFFAYLAFGFGEWQTRLPSAVASIVIVFALYRLVKREASHRAAILSSAIYVALPMNLYFGAMPEVLASSFVLFSLLAIDAYVRLHDQQGAGRLAWLVVAFIAAALTDWPAFFLVPVFLVHFAATRPRSSWPWILAFCSAAAVVFVGLNAYVALAAQLPWDWIVPLFLHRSAIGSASGFSAAQWWSTALRFNRHLHTLPVLVLAGLWLVRHGMLRDRRDAGQSRSGTNRWRVARILMAWAILHVAVGRQGVFNHEWWWWPLTPGVAVTAALMIESLLVMFERRFSTRTLSAFATVAMVIFAVWTSTLSYRELFPPREPQALTTRDLGQAIRAAAPGPADLSLLVWSGFDPQLWFYGDRALRANVWSVSDLERSVQAHTADLLFGFEQPWTGAATGIVFPTQFRDEMKELHEFLGRRYRLAPLAPELRTKFEIYDLRPIPP